jgi:hypothetical protein
LDAPVGFLAPREIHAAARLGIHWLRKPQAAYRHELHVAFILLPSKVASGLHCLLFQQLEGCCICLGV